MLVVRTTKFRGRRQEEIFDASPALEAKFPAVGGWYEDTMMQAATDYRMIVEWSEEDGCFVGRCPKLFYGGCHGDDEKAVFDELRLIVRDVLDGFREEA